MSLRVALRSLVRAPGFSIVVILTLAIGIGATTAMVSIVNGVLFRALPFPEPDSLHLVEGRVTGLGDSSTPAFAVSGRHYAEWRTHCQSCQDIALVGAYGLTLTGSGAAERLPGLEVSFNFFRTLGVAPQIGRDFSVEDEGPGGFHVVLLSDVLWRTRFGADPSVVGRSITLNGEAHTILGVMPPTLTLPRGTQWGPFFPLNRVPVIFRPVGLSFASVRTWGSFNYASLVRTRPAASREQAASEMTAAVADFARQEGVSLEAVLTPMAQRMTRTVREGLIVLGAAVGTLLVLVALNIGGLLLVRSVAQSRDAGIRLALGATGTDLVRPMLIEVLLLVGTGAVVGTALAAFAVRAFVATAPANLPRADELRPDWSMLAFSLAVTTLVAFLAALAPLSRLLRAAGSRPLTSATRGATETRGRLRALTSLMVCEVSLSTAVLVLGGLLAMSFVNVMLAERGFETERVVTQALPLSGPGYQRADGRSRMIDRALDAFRSIPGVTTVGVTSQLPLRGETWVDTLLDADRPGDERKAPLVNRRFISASYFDAIGIRLIEGRDFRDSDRQGSPVAVISERTATLLWPGQSPLGRHVFKSVLGPPNTPKEKAEVVGVVADVRSAGLEQDAAPIIYEPYWVIGPGGPAFVLRTARDVSSLSADIRSAVAALDPTLPAAPAQSMGEIVSEAAAIRRFQTMVVAAFAAASLTIAALGLYGLVTFAVARRTRELGLRAALGATRGRILAMMLAQGLRPVAIGGAIGIAFALVAGDVLASQLYGVTANDPRVLAAVAAALGIVAVGACWTPALRATHVDPMITLRAE